MKLFQQDPGAAVLYLMTTAPNHQGHLDTIYYPDSVSNAKSKSIPGQFAQMPLFLLARYEAGRRG